VDKAAAFRNGMSAGKCAELVGINMEGPFLSLGKAGAQNHEYLAAPDADMVRRLDERSGGLIKIIALAPELDGAMEFIDNLLAAEETQTAGGSAPDEMRDSGKRCGKYRISLAHTGADYETAYEAFDHGMNHITHLYNAMQPMHHRAPGPIPAGIEHHAEAEIIADGVHIEPAMVRLAFRMFGEDRMILISDSMEACGMPDGQYQLGGQDVTVCGNRAVLTDNPDTVAGSVTNLYKCMRCAVREMGIPLEAAVRAATMNPAVSIGIQDRYGSIEPGKIASLVIADTDLNIRAVILRGRVL